MTAIPNDLTQVHKKLARLKAAQTILVVDDDPQIRKTLQRQLTALDTLILTAESADEAIQRLGEHQISVLVTDQHMPGTTGTELLDWAKINSPATVRVMITADADLHTVLSAINTGEVFRFVPKPWSQQNLQHAVLDALKAHRAEAEREILLNELIQTNQALRSMNTHLLDLVDERTSEIQAKSDFIANSFKASIEMVLTIMGFADTRIMDHCSRTRDRVEDFAALTDLDDPWQDDLNIAAMCHWIGLINAPVSTISLPLQNLPPEDQSNWEYHPIVGEMVVAQVPALDRAARIIGHYMRPPDDPTFKNQPELHTACQTLKICSAFEREFTIRCGLRHSDAEVCAIQTLERGRDSEYDSRVLNQFLAHLITTKQ